VSASALDSRSSLSNHEESGQPVTNDFAGVEGRFMVNGEGEWPSYREIAVDCWQGNEHESRLDYVAEEVPVAILYNGAPHVVMMATPRDLEDFAYGFSLTEEVVASPSQLLSVREYRRVEGIEVRVRISEECIAGLGGKERNLTGRTGCGLCGAATLRQAVRHPPPVGGELRVAARDLQEAMQTMRTYQTINRLTGAVHAAAWVVPGKGVVNVREDVGRHNALDKLIGVLARTRSDCSGGFVLVTSRASYELVQKVAIAGIGMLAAISAPTGLAIRLAKETGVTLVGFARGDRHVIYSNPQRILHND
jgi:FdhD protein